MVSTGSPDVLKCNHSAMPPVDKWSIESSIFIIHLTVCHKIIIIKKKKETITEPQRSLLQCSHKGLMSKGLLTLHWWQRATCTMVQHWCGDFIGNLSQTILNTPQRLPVLLSDVPTIANRIAVNREPACVIFSDDWSSYRPSIWHKSNAGQTGPNCEFDGDYAQSFSEYQT